MKHLVLAIALTGLMSMTVLAGDIPTNDAPAPPPTTTSSTSSSTLLVTVILTVLGLR